MVGITKSLPMQRGANAAIELSRKTTAHLERLLKRSALLNIEILAERVDGSQPQTGGLIYCGLVPKVDMMSSTWAVSKLSMASQKNIDELVATSCAATVCRQRPKRAKVRAPLPRRAA